MASTPTLVQTANIGFGVINNATASAFVNVASGGASGSKVVALTVASTDTSARVVQVQVNRSGANVNICAANVAAASGTDGVTPSVSLFGATLFPGLAIDNDGQPYLFLQSGDVLQVATTTTVTSAKFVYVTCYWGNF